MFRTVAAAAQLEGSKAFTKSFMARHGFPPPRIAPLRILAAAEAIHRERGAPIVVKADGLAAGKGVVVARDRRGSVGRGSRHAVGDAFGAAGARVVIEDCLVGEEASFICIADGRRAVPFASSQDHKARDDGDRGPNTGGMGAYSPAPVVTPAIHERIMAEVIRPTLDGMTADGVAIRRVPVRGPDDRRRTVRRT